MQGVRLDPITGARFDLTQQLRRQLHIEILDGPGFAAGEVAVGIGAVAINGGGNVSSITDNGVGDYTVNFIVAMPDANYAVSGSGKFDSTNINSVVPNFGIRRSPNNPTPSSVRIHCGAEYSLDCEIVTVAIFC